MSNFNVETKGLQRMFDQMWEVSQRIESLKGQIDDLLVKTQFQSANNANIVQSLNAVMNVVGSDIGKVRCLANVLSEISSVYSQTENKILGCVLEKEWFSRSIDRLKKEIGEIGGLLGMDSAALYSSDPVNLANGNYVYEKSFFHFDTILSMNFRMFYNAGGDYIGALGRGWLHNFEQCVIAHEDSCVIRGEDGALHRFYRVEAGRYLPAAGVTGELVQTADGWRYTSEESDNYYFDHLGKLFAEETIDGWRIDLKYENNQLSGVTCTDGISLRFFYNVDGRLECISDSADRVISFIYENEYLVKVQGVMGEITQYEYDLSGRMCKVISPSGDLSVKNIYDEYGRTINQKFADGGVVTYCYDDDANAVTMGMQNGNTIKYYHDDLFRNNRIVYRDGEELFEFNSDNQRIAYTDKLGRVTRYEYDDAGKMVRFINATGDTMSFGYNHAGQLTEVLMGDLLLGYAKYDENGHQVLYRNANGVTTEVNYDDKGRAKEFTHEDGSKTILEYDEYGRVIGVRDPVTGCTRYSYDQCHRVSCSEDSLGNKTYYEYDNADQLKKVINAEGHERNYYYDLRGNIVKIVDYNGGVVVAKYNEMNRPVQIEDADGNVTTFEYDEMLNLIRKTAADGGVIEYKYDEENRMIGIRKPMGGVETAEYDAVGNLVHRRAADGGDYYFKYDVLNRPVSVTDPMNGERRVEYDKLGNIIAIYYEDGSKEHFSYDLMGNCLSYMDQSGYEKFFSYNELGKVTEIRDEEGILAQFSYGHGGQLIEERGVDGRSLAYFYDVAGNVVKVEDNVHGVWEFQYNKLGKMCQAEHVGEGIERYTYDLQGNIDSFVDGNGNRTEYQFSKAGALIKVVNAWGNEMEYCYDPCYRIKQILQVEGGADACVKDQILSFEWDFDGNLLSEKNGAGECIQYRYDQCGRVVEKVDQEGNVTSCVYRKDGMEDMLMFSDGHTIKYQYDALKRLSQIEDWIGVTSINRDAVGRIVEINDCDSNRIGYAWNGRGMCTNLTYPDGKMVSYEYDERTRLIRSRGEGEEIHYKYYENGQLKERCFSNELKTVYGYDGNGRISMLKHCLQGSEVNSFTYLYDACSRKSQVVHNRAGFPEQKYGFEYDSLGCLSGVTYNGRLSQCYEYDMFGNRSRMIKDGLETTYSYDKLGRLRLRKSNEEETVYHYDRRGNMIGETVDGIRKRTLFFDARNRMERAVTESGEAEYVYNGLAMLNSIKIKRGDRIEERKLIFDYRDNSERLLSVCQNGIWENHIWDHEPVCSSSVNEFKYLLNDERMSTFASLQEKELTNYWFDPYGVERQGGHKSTAFGFTGYRRDEITGYFDGGWRQYDAVNGRFISQDPFAGNLLVPISLNPYIYCMSDPINHLDPTGRIVAWLAGGIVGAVANVGVKFAGDIVASIKEGKWAGSSWQSYVGTAAGGFVQGTVFVAAGPTAAGAAGGATETLVTNGLSMLFGKEGYRKEDGYGIDNLLLDTGTAAAEGAVSGFTFGQAAKYLKIPKITSGRGSCVAVWKQVMTKARRGQIANVTMKTLGKGLLSYGLVKTVDEFIDKGIDAFKERIQKSIQNKAKDIFDVYLSGNETKKSMPDGMRMLVCTSKSATCATA